ncbi:Roundabout 1 [Cichlidogyrus casuarinus]|uniref:Roundabout 1 n=1 Tax=Cichlidogyrus casuarinus TaxID=1844966 RepID=A0ABD2PR79_9PLAT
MTSLRPYYRVIPVFPGFLLLWTFVWVRGDEAPFEPQFEEESKPEILFHPENNFLPRGSNFNLRCEAKGVPDPVVEWYKDKERIQTARERPGTSAYAKSSTSLYIYDFDNDQEGNYYCNASNSIGWVQSRTANVKIAYLNDFANPPVNKHVIVGEPVTLRCGRPDGLPRPKLSWLHNNRPLNHSSRVSISDHEVFISRTEKIDSGRYYCTVVNSVGIKQSQPIELLVKEKPEFAIRPSDKIIKLGDTVIFNCQIRGDPTPTVFWRRDNSPITQSRSSTPDDRKVQVGGSTRFDCVATGSPMPSLRWRLDDQDFLLPESEFEVADQGLAGQRNRIQTFYNGSLFIREVRKSDEGKYECRASTGSGTVKSSAVLSVLDAYSFPIPVIDVPPQNVTVKLDDPFELHCSAFKHNVEDLMELSLSYTWTKEGDNVGTGPSFRIDHARYSDAGLYTCNVVVFDHRNKNTVTRSSAVVHVGPLSLPPVQHLPSPVDSFEVRETVSTIESSVGGFLGQFHWFLTGSLILSPIN